MHLTLRESSCSSVSETNRSIVSACNVILPAIKISPSFVSFPCSTRRQLLAAGQDAQSFARSIDPRRPTMTSPASFNSMASPSSLNGSSPKPSGQHRNRSPNDQTFTDTAAPAINGKLDMRREPENGDVQVNGTHGNSAPSTDGKTDKSTKKSSSFFGKGFSERAAPPQLTMEKFQDKDGEHLTTIKSVVSTDDDRPHLERSDTLVSGRRPTNQYVAALCLSSFQQVSQMPQANSYLLHYFIESASLPSPSPSTAASKPSGSSCTRSPSPSSSPPSSSSPLCLSPGQFSSPTSSTSNSPALLPRGHYPAAAASRAASPSGSSSPPTSPCGSTAAKNCPRRGNTSLDTIPTGSFLTGRSRPL